MYLEVSLNEDNQKLAMGFQLCYQVFSSAPSGSSRVAGLMLVATTVIVFGY
ncbi:3905_t:CDS:2 [Rhizophagus irregularis]|nr:3905_t:CDS:2 [Rhizophagus irregularis]